MTLLLTHTRADRPFEIFIVLGSKKLSWPTLYVIYVRYFVYGKTRRFQLFIVVAN